MKELPPQQKKNPDDPDVDQINPEIIKLAHGHAFIRQPIELYLNGELTWVQTLETIVLLMTKEYRAQGRLLMEVMREAGPKTTTLLTGASGKQLLKLMPPTPLRHEPRPTGPTCAKETP